MAMRALVFFLRNGEHIMGHSDVRVKCNLKKVKRKGREKKKKKKNNKYEKEKKKMK